MSQYGDGDYCSVFDRTERTAKKQHRCDACHEAIEPGHTYSRTFSVYDGDTNVTKRCARCEAIFAHLSTRMVSEGHDEEFCAAELNCGHDYKERWKEDPPEWLAALAFWRPGDPLPARGAGQ